MGPMLSLAEAQERLLALAPRTEETVSGQWSQIRYAARDIMALRSQPPHDLSAMDGYAVSGEGPWEMVGESRAGHPFSGDLSHGQCTRISTGAWIPSGADRVLIQENATVSGTTIALAAGQTDPEVGKHIRKKGFDFVKGEVLVPAGTRLGPAQIALGRAGGQDDFLSCLPPLVDILECGDELEECASVCIEGVADVTGAEFKIPATNGAMIGEMLMPYVPYPFFLGPVGDDMGELFKALERSEGNILIISGGASVGDHDLVQDALREWGAEIDFWRVAIKPGKPLLVATKGEKVILGLPGNPVSSFVTCFLFALPLVRASMGAEEPISATMHMTAVDALPATGPRHEFLRGVHDGKNVRLAGSQDSSALISLSKANCLISRPPNSPPLTAGEQVAVYNLQNG